MMDYFTQDVKMAVFWFGKSDVSGEELVLVGSRPLLLRVYVLIRKESQLYKAQ